MKTTIDMAREAGIEFQHIIGILGKETISTMGSQRLELIEQLVALVRADEREACAKVCEELDAEYEAVCQMTSVMCGQAIRNRGNT
jgi:hypothetical protein